MSFNHTVTRIKKSFSNTLKHIISDIPNPANLSQFSYTKVSHEMIVMKTDFSKKKRLKANLIIFFIIVVLGFLLSLINKEPGYSWILPYLIIFVLPPFLFFSIYSYIIIISGESEMILNRLKGTVRIPCGILKKPIEKPFNEAIAFYGSATNYGNYYIGLRFQGYGRGAILSNSPNLPGEWALFLWYMDKNRPLPPGNAFADFRKIDAARLRAAGHPEPLYPMSPEVKKKVEKFYEAALNADISDEEIPDEIE